jgi:hypothetical protein
LEVVAEVGQIEQVEVAPEVSELLVDLPFQPEVHIP